MGCFDNVRFKGKFRDYQQRIIDNSDKYLKDGRINIVAAPGSGKTVLGLELIRRIGAPAIILSPTTAIREQWGARFKDMFTRDGEALDKMVSTDLNNIKTLNSITYQALYTAIEKKDDTSDNDDNYSDIDIFAAMKGHGIKTVCLDEAHHLKNEWQRALEKFIGALDKGVKIISLTATPPYDSEGNEWERYVNVCGEIDEEIFVPELVKQKTLCPHQDYIYFNYPTEDEISGFSEYKQRVITCLDEIGKLPFIKRIADELEALEDNEVLFASVKEYIALFVLLKRFGHEADKKLIKALAAGKGLPEFSFRYAEIAVQFLIDGDLLSEEERVELTAILKRNNTYDKRKVAFELNEKLKRVLLSSVGKLESIKNIALSEAQALGKDLRMLVLTDFIKKESLASISENERFSSVNVVSIFETLRRADTGARIAVLSGTLVILPRSISLSGVRCRKTDIPDTEYCTVEFSGATNRAVEFVGRLFESGEVQILIGTKSLLGEGWDSPCINSLILASFVGSFVLSNQMRGRAIRINKADPKKVANIWHLVTIEPPYLLADKTLDKVQLYLAQRDDELISCDYEMLERRFESFMAPNYETGVVESGIERISIIKPPFDKKGIADINAKMITLSKNRDAVRDMWRESVSDGALNVCIETEVDKEKRIRIFAFRNLLLDIMVMCITALIVRWMITASLHQEFVVAIFMLAITAFLTKHIANFVKDVLMYFNPARNIKTLGTAIYKTLKECGVISADAQVQVIDDRRLSTVAVRLKNATIHDQNIFNIAMTEMLSPIENPRYVLIARRHTKSFNYELSFACPSIIGKKREYVDVLTRQLKSCIGRFEPVFIHSEEGRRLILKCRKHSYITQNMKATGKKYKVSPYE